MSVAEDLTDFARKSGAIPSIYNGGGVTLTWDAGHSQQRTWDTKNLRCPQAFHGEDEYLGSRVPTMISDYGKIMLNWATIRIGEKARWRYRWPRIDVPTTLENVAPQWGSGQLTPTTDRLTLGGAYIPMEIHTILPVHPELNQLSQVMQIDFDELPAGYMDSLGGPLLRQRLS